MRASMAIGLLLGVAAVVASGCGDQPFVATSSAGGPATSGPATSGPTSSGATGSAPPSFVRPTPNPSPTFLVHEVRAGESLTSIARQYGTTARSIAYWNRDRYPSLDPDSSGYQPDRIVVGWLLRLIPTEVVDEDDLPEPTETSTPTPASTGSALPSASGVPTAGAGGSAEPS